MLPVICLEIMNFLMIFDLFTSNLLPHRFIFIIKLKIGTIVKGFPHESHHFVLIQINLAFIIIVFLIKNIIYTTIAVCFSFHFSEPPSCPLVNAILEAIIYSLPYQSPDYNARTFQNATYPLATQPLNTLAFLPPDSQ